MRRSRAIIPISNKLGTAVRNASTVAAGGSRRGRRKTLPLLGPYRRHSGRGMNIVERDREVGLPRRDGMNERVAADHIEISRERVKNTLRFSVSPGTRRGAQVRDPKQDGFTVC